MRSSVSLHRVGIAAAFTALVLAILVLPLPTANSAGKTRVIHIDASQYEFMPGRIEVNQGDHVVFEITSTDVMHGFYLDGYGIQERIQPGITQTIEFTADQPGKHYFRCSVTCGPVHPFMIGELVVGPNPPFWRSVGAMIAAATGMLVWLWGTREQKPTKERADESI